MIRARVVGLLGLVFGCACATNQPAAVTTPRNHADAIVVLGHRPPLRGAELEYETRARVERGIALFHEGRAARLLFSGGTSTPNVVEADVMAAYAAQRGVPEEALLRERASRDTIENARLSVSLLRGALQLTRRPTILLVTSDYHVARAARLFQCAGADVAQVAVPLALSDEDRAKRVRSERWVRFYYRFIDECERAGGQP